MNSTKGEYMNKNDIINIANEFVINSTYNYVSKEDAISEEFIGMKIFDEPIFAFGNAMANEFKLLKSPAAVGEIFMLPTEWLTGATTVISFFLPFTNMVVNSNKADKYWPTAQWLHGRIEGQKFVIEITRHINDKIIEKGYQSIVPTLDKRFKLKKNESDMLTYTSSWSERHVAFLCGLGTFGLSRGIITKKGMAGRLGSIITNLKLEADKKFYTDLYEYCTMCGACIKKCPVNAISLKEGKDHIKCSGFLDLTKEIFNPRYGCGKCQISVPCSRQIPKTI